MLIYQNLSSDLGIKTTAVGQPEVFMLASLQRLSFNLMANRFENLLVIYLGLVKIKCYLGFWGARNMIALHARVTGGDVVKHCMHICALGTA